MWFGTQDGLNKYDGYKFTVYKYDPLDLTSLSDSNVTSIIEDKKGFLWIGTNNGGLNKFDLKTEKSIHYKHDPNNPNSLSDNHITVICQDPYSEGTFLWIGTFGGGLDKFNVEREEYTNYRNDPCNSNSLSNNHITAICEDPAQGSCVLWLGTYGGGVSRFDVEKEEFTHYCNDSSNPNSLIVDYVNAIWKDSDVYGGLLWIGTYGAGLDKFEPAKEQFTHYRYISNNPHSINHPIVTSIYRDKEGMLWIGTIGAGLNRFDRETEMFDHWVHEPENPYSLNSNYVSSIYEDRSGVMWIGAAGSGLDIFEKEGKHFKHYRQNPSDPKSLNHNIIYSLYEDRKGVLWIGTNGGGLNRFDRRENEFRYYVQGDENVLELGNDFIRAIYEDRSGRLWIGSYGGLDSFNRKTEEFTNYRNNPSDPNSLSNNIVNVIYEDRVGNFWIGTEDGGLNKFDRERETFKHYVKDAGNPNSLSNNHITTIYEDSKKTLWIGTKGGLNKFNREKQRFVHYIHDPDNPNSLSHNRVFSIHEDKSGTLWIGTHSGGLNKFDRTKKEFTHFTEKDGLPNNVIYGILSDDRGHLWISTNKGLSEFDPQTETFKNYDVHDGLQSNEFNMGACYKSRSGEMFFGGINGFNVFYPGRIKDNPYIPPVVITNIQIFNKSVPIGEKEDSRSILKKSITETEEIELSYKDYVFSLEFAALHYACPEKNEYAYMMEGFEKDWNYVGNRRFVTYTTLSPGNYVFRAKGSNNDGIWNEEGTSLKITVTHPFWQTWWFRISGIIAILLVIFSVHQVKTRNIRERSKLLGKRVEERTAKLNAANKKLEDFAYIVSHDLKAPLRAINQLTEWISRDYASAFDKSGKEQMDLLVGRVKHMDNLIDGILQYSRAGRIKGSEKQVDLNNVVKEVIDTLAPPKNIHVTIEDKLPVILAETVRIEQVFQNLIGNAIKYMDKPKGEIRIGYVDEKNHWKFNIADNGPGIEEKYYDKIFQIFQTLESRDKRESTGVGLALVKKIVELYGGKIWVESKTGEGSTFFFTLRKIKIRE